MTTVIRQRATPYGNGPDRRFGCSYDGKSQVHYGRIGPSDSS